MRLLAYFVVVLVAITLPVLAFAGYVYCAMWVLENVDSFPLAMLATMGPPVIGLALWIAINIWQDEKREEEASQ